MGDFKIKDYWAFELEKSVVLFTRSEHEWFVGCAVVNFEQSTGVTRPSTAISFQGLLFDSRFFPKSLELKESGIELHGYVQGIETDGDHTMVICVRKNDWYDCYYHFVVNKPYSLCNWAVYNLRITANAKPETYDFITSKLPSTSNHQILTKTSFHLIFKHESLVLIVNS
ncbi:hypothetical protein M3Y94_00411900 [Aphelenchoides besseyi]|nr:hypothetical protein M3Y94_00411900 [Aphelenchoides besseyi]